MNNETLLGALVRIISKLPQIFSGLLSFTGLAYVIGWIKARAYFEELGAPWMVDMLSYKEIIGYSWMPLILIAFITWIVIMRIEEQNDSDFRELISKGISYSSLVVASILYIATLSLGHFKFYQLAYIGNFLTFFIYLLIFISALFSVIYLIRDGEFVGDKFDASVVYLVVIAGIYALPSLDGRMAAGRSMDPDVSKLPMVKIEGKEKLERMLLIKNNNVYTILNNEIDTTLSTIHISPKSDIEYITSSKWKEQ